VGLRLGGVDVKRIVDCNRRRLGKLAAGGLARDLHHRLHPAVDLEPVPDEEKDLDLFKKSLGLEVIMAAVATRPVDITIFNKVLYFIFQGLFVTKVIKETT